MKEHRFKLAKEKTQKIPAQTITIADYADAIALLANTPAQAKSFLHSLERAADGIHVRVNTDKTEYMCFNQRGDNSTRKDGPLKLVKKFTNLRNRVSCTENHIIT